jgi:hypothetical protein
MVQRNNRLIASFCFQKDLHMYFSSTVPEPERGCQIVLLPAISSKVCKCLKTILLRMDELQTRFLVTPHSLEVLISAEKIIIRLDFMMKCCAFSNLIRFYAVKEMSVDLDLYFLIF